MTEKVFFYFHLQLVYVGTISKMACIRKCFLPHVNDGRMV